jgi:hypothetical protein
VSARARVATRWAAAALGVALLAAAPAAQAPAAAPESPVPAQDGAPRDAAAAESVRVPDRLPPGAPTRMGQELLAPAEIVAVLKVVSVREAGPGAVIVRGIVLEALHSVPERPTRPGDELVLMTIPGPVVAGARELVFLRSMGSGTRLEPLYRTDSSDPGYAPKLEAARRTLELARLEDPGERAAAALDWLLEALAAEPAAAAGPGEAPPDWWARYALDELAWMAREQPRVFRPGDGVRVARAGRRWSDGELAADVEAVSQAVREAARRLYGSADKAPSPP